MNRELDDDQLTELKNAVFSTQDDANGEYEMIPNDGKTRCRFTPIPDVDALLRTLRKHFNGAPVRLDAEAKTIYVELK